MVSNLLLLYRSLAYRFGPQHWWPAQSPFEVMVGAVLTQNTSWANVEKAIRSLRANGMLSCAAIRRVSNRRLAGVIRSAGYYNLKAGRLKTFAAYFYRRYRASARRMAAQNVGSLRQELLSVKGIGPETADSILLYALDKPAFVVDAYTKRILARHRLIPADASYDQVQSFCTANLPRDVRIFNELHALLVRLAKEYCLKSSPRCGLCPLKKSSFRT